MPTKNLTSLFTSSFISISCDMDRSWLYVDWLGYQTVSSVQEGCNQILALMVEHQAYRILNDNEHVVGIWSGASEWVAKEWFPRMRKAGMRRFAWVYSPTRFSQISTDTTLSMMQGETQGVMLFSDVKEAISWLHESDKREEHLSDWVEKGKRLGVPQEVIAGVVGNNWTPARAWREHLGLTQSVVAARIGLSQIEYAAREALTHISRSDLESIAWALGIVPEFLDMNR
jgi:hypothetical protein